MTPISRTALFLIIAASLSACATPMKRYEYPPTVNASEEITRLDQEMKDAVRDQVDVLAPDDYADARKNLDQANFKNANSAPNADILEKLGYARAYLDAAKISASRADASMPEVLQARSDALLAEAPRLRNADLIDDDQALEKVARGFETGTPIISVETRGELQKKYIELEIASIAKQNLELPKSLIEAALKMGAEKYAKENLESAQAKYQTAELTIETERHNSTAIARAANAATEEARHTIEITRLAKGIKGKTPEELAIEEDALRNEVAHENAMAEQNSEKLEKRLYNRDETIFAENKTIHATDTKLGRVDAESARLERDKKFNDALTAAQAKFSTHEAEVYRQDGNLVVRIKSMRFPSGRAELPSASFDVLEKVKQVIASLDADKVVIEGNTDSIGGDAFNQSLSEKRADAVMNYFVQEDAIPSKQIEAKGFGDSHPLASNKTMGGRAENRRVDIVISPSKMAFGSTDSMDSSMSSAKRPSNNGEK